MNTELIMIAAELGIKGMTGIFTVLGLLSLCVWGLSEMDKRAGKQ